MPHATDMYVSGDHARRKRRLANIVAPCRCGHCVNYKFPDGPGWRGGKPIMVEVNHATHVRTATARSPDDHQSVVAPLGPIGRARRIREIYLR